ncbi:MAG TPA: ABC transporter permease [Streptosporangiaceae bacterium]|nr:ABC transporter permease [Streptosporangiaceae bacterium]
MSASETLAFGGPAEAGEISSRQGAPSGGGRLTLAAFLHNRRTMSGVGIVALMGLFCFIGPVLYHTNQVTVNLAIINQPPGPGHPLGTDEYGIDVLGRLMVGGQSSLELGFAVGIASTVLGALYGALSGVVGGVGDGILMRIIDTLLAVPLFILLIIVASMFSLSLSVIILILAVLSWPGVARLVRGQVLALRNREFAQAATSMGSTRWGVLFRHMIPNTLGICIVTATFGIADAIYALSALSFLGIGPPPPFTDWGTMLTDGVNNLFNGYWWQVYPPMFALVLVVLAFRQIGDALNDIVSGGQTGRVFARRRRRFGWVPMSTRYE